jgi:hypothetical protein
LSLPAVKGAAVVLQAEGNATELTSRHGQPRTVA